MLIFKLDFVFETSGKEKQVEAPAVPHVLQASMPIFWTVRAAGEAYWVQLFVGKRSAAAALNVRVPQVLGIVRAPEWSERPRRSRA